MNGCSSSKTARKKGSSYRSKVYRIVKRLTLLKPESVTDLRGGTASTDDFPVTGTPEIIKNRSKLPIEELAEKRPALLEAPIAYLHVYLSDGQNREKNLQRSPSLYFALRQCSLTYRYICTRLQKRTLKALMLRDSMANLIMLLQTLGRLYPEIAQSVADQMQKFIAILEDLDRQLAELSNVQALNWQTISTIINTTVQDHLTYLDPRHFTEFVPSIDDFVQTKLLGRGAFGAVYKATFKGELDVAVKVVPQHKFRNAPKDDSPYMDKMVAAVVSNHPYICRIFCVFLASNRDTPSNIIDSPRSSPSTTVEKSPGVSVTVMEAIDGLDLTELIGRTPTLTFNLTQILMQQCMLAIEHLHLSGFVHRDIKPANMIVMRDGRLKLIDFDVSRICIGHFSSTFQMSYFNRTALEFAGGDKAGTEAYMAPEVHQNKGFGRASDWWSIGVVHFRLAFGRLPFRHQQLAWQIVNQEIEWDKVGRPGDIQQTALKNYLSKLMVKEPRHRLGSHDYADIFDHPLFGEVNWLKLPEQDMYCDELEATFAERGSNYDDKAVASLLPGGGGSLNKDDLPNLRNLCDNLKEHMPLLTFTSKLIKKMVTGDPGPDASDDAPRWRHVSELRKSGDDTTGGTTMAENKQKKDPVQVIIQDVRGPRKLCAGQRRAITLRRLLSEDGLFRFLVSDIADGTKVLSEARLYYGDLVLEIDKTSLTNLPNHRVVQLLSRKGSPLVLSVAPGNPFRDAGEATFNMSQLLFRFKTIRLAARGTLKTPKCACCRSSQIVHGFTLSVRRVCSSGAAELICFVDSHEVSLQKVALIQEKCQQRSTKDDKDAPNIYAGDIVLGINNMRLEQLVRGAEPEKQVRALAANMSVELDILPCSPIRVGNLPLVIPTL